MSRPASWAGQSKPLGQTVKGPRAISGVPQEGHSAGGAQAGPRSRSGSSIRSTTWGMTSPARWMRTRSPSRMSLRATSSRLWRVARLTVTPPISTGRIIATGVTTPVRPTLARIASTRVISLRGGNLKAKAQRGCREVVPSRSRAARSSSLITTPSISKPRSSRRASRSAW